MAARHAPSKARRDCRSYPAAGAATKIGSALGGLIYAILPSGMVLGPVAVTITGERAPGDATPPPRGGCTSRRLALGCLAAGRAALLLPSGAWRATGRAFGSAAARWARGCSNGRLARAFCTPLSLIPGGGALLATAGAIRAARFIRGSTTNAEWVSSVRNAPAPWGEVGSSKLIISTQRSALRALDDPQKTMVYWDKVCGCVCGCVGGGGPLKHLKPNPKPLNPFERSAWGRRGVPGEEGWGGWGWGRGTAAH
jgi:hypothetical protein